MDIEKERDNIMLCAAKLAEEDALSKSIEI